MDGENIATEQPEIANAVSADGLGNVYITGWSMGFFAEERGRLSEQVRRGGLAAVDKAIRI